MLDNAVNQDINNQVVQIINKIENFRYLDYKLLKIENLIVNIQTDFSSSVVTSSPFIGEGSFSYNDGIGTPTERFRFSGYIELDGLRVVAVNTPPFTLIKK